MLLNGYATAVVTVTMTAAIRAVGNASASFDILSRPSAFDIAQEVWNAQKAAFAGAGTMGAAQSEAERAAKLAAALSA